MTRVLKEPVPLPIHDAARRGKWHGVARGVAVAAALFCLFVAGRLVVRVVQNWTESPLAAAESESIGQGTGRLVTEFRAQQRELTVHPEDEKVKQRIRELDLLLRQRYFARQAELASGAYLLLGGLVVLLLALKARAQWGPATPGVMQVFSAPTDPWQALGGVRTAIGVGGGVAALGLLALGFAGGPSFVPARTSGAAAVSATGKAPWATPAERMKQWPSFRGPLGCGITALTTAPTDWDGVTGRGILWKTAVPLPGASSPIVWDDKVFLTGATEGEQEVYCFSASSGALVWKRTVKGPVAGGDIRVNPETGFAACTMATDGLRVYAMFPTGDLAAFDFSGESVWSKNLGKPDSTYGFAASLATYKDRVIVQFDGGAEEKEGKSALLALDGASGKQVWKTRREVANSWSSPIVCYLPAGAQIITAARPWVIAYEADTGRELWKANVLNGDVAASPACAGDRVFVANDQAKAAAIRADGLGDVTATHVVWTAEDGLPEMVSPLATEDFVLLVNGAGTVTCYHAHSGAKLWEQEFEGTFQASPVLVGKTIYLVDTKGVMHLFEAGKAYKELGKAALGEDVSATPAFVGGRIFLRGKTNLYCIGEGK